mmetsp:Transcript_29775/g.60032  ORF Transcript_29775/g.60032 Transcript_29775/m.60032 type:complete len:144 (+) Transcript_29775:289-720(+)
MRCVVAPSLLLASWSRASCSLTPREAPIHGAFRVVMTITFTAGLLYVLTASAVCSCEADEAMARLRLKIFSAQSESAADGARRSCCCNWPWWCVGSWTHLAALHCGNFHRVSAAPCAVAHPQHCCPVQPTRPHVVLPPPEAER